MNRLFAIIFPLLLILMIILIPITRVDESNESSYQYGYMAGSLKSPGIDTYDVHYQTVL